MITRDYPFARSFITDAQGKVQQVILDLEDYNSLLELIEDEGLYQAMQETQDEDSLSLEEALIELEAS